MSLALRLFFWADWLPITPTPAPTSTPQSGGGGGHKHRNLYTDDYPHAELEYWDTRERYLRSLIVEVVPPIITSKEPIDDETAEEKLARFTASRAELISAIRNAPDSETLKLYGDKLSRLNKEIESYIAKITPKH